IDLAVELGHLSVIQSAPRSHQLKTVATGGLDNFAEPFYRPIDTSRPAEYQICAACPSRRPQNGNNHPRRGAKPSRENPFHDRSQSARGANDGVAVGQMALDELLGCVRARNGPFGHWLVLPTMIRNLLDDALAIEAELLVAVVPPKTDMKQVVAL